MAPRDKLKTERNKLIKSMTAELRLLQPLVLSEARLDSEQRLNAIIGSKADEFIDLKNAIISTPEEYVTIWMDGLTKFCAQTPRNSRYNIFFDIVAQSENYQRYLHLFLRRSFLNHYEELYRTRPTVDAAEVWIGQNNANYGLLVTPRFGSGVWENDKSEIRRFRPRYWSIGHVLETGLVIPGRDEKIPFRTVGDYLAFFKNVLVRAAASTHQDAVAERYCRFVETSNRAQDVPLLIPDYKISLGLAGQKGVASSQGEGTSYKKLICALFDLALLRVYEDIPFFHFVYHDGMLEALDDRKKLAFLDVVREQVSSHKLQYIMTVIASDLPRDEKGGVVAFADDEIVLRLDDSGPGGRLFKMAEF